MTAHASARIYRGTPRNLALLAKALREGGSMPVTLDDGLRAFAMIDAAYRSTRSGRVEPVSV